jgi:hypothetical protein
MAVTLNRSAFEHAKELINEGRFVFDERDAWSEHQPSAQQENEFIQRHGFAEYGKWHLGINNEKPEDTKGHYEFPYGDFKHVHRCWTPGKARLPRSTPAPRERQRAGLGIRRDNRFACSAVYGPKHQAEHHAQEQTGHEREVECHIFPLNHDVAGEPSQPDPAQQGPKQAGHQKHEAQHDQKARHRHVSSPVAASIFPALAEQLQQHHEKIYEVEIERERTEHRFLIRDFGRV